MMGGTGVTVGYRVVLAVLAWVGVVMSVLDSGPMNLTYFTQVSGALVALTTTGSLLYPLLRGAEPDRGVLRGVSAACSMITLLVFATLLGADYSDPVSLLLHLVVPLLALGDWVLLGRNQGRVPAWVPLVWVVFPLAYLPLYLWATAASGHPLYDFLDPGSATFVPTAAALTVIFVIMFYLYWGLGKLTGRLRRGSETAGTAAP